MKITIEQNNVKISLDIEEKPTPDLIVKYMLPQIIQHVDVDFVIDDKYKINAEERLNTPTDEEISSILREKKRIPWTETHIKQLKKFKKSNDATLPDISEATGIPEWRINKYYYGGYKTISMSDLLAIQEMMKNE